MVAATAIISLVAVAAAAAISLAKDLLWGMVVSAYVFNLDALSRDDPLPRRFTACLAGKELENP